MTIIPHIDRPDQPPTDQEPIEFVDYLHVKKEDVIYYVGTRPNPFRNLGDDDITVLIEGFVLISPIDDVAGGIGGYDITVTGTVISEAFAVNSDNGRVTAYGIGSSALGKTITNSGTVLASVDIGSATAVYSFDSEVMITNSGLIAARTTGEAAPYPSFAQGITAFNGGWIHNQVGGQILVESERAVGIIMGHGRANLEGRPNIRNDGIIKVVALNENYDSVGLSLASYKHQKMQVLNNGYLEADIAISFSSPGFPPSVGYQSINNTASGIIRGDILGELGVEAVTNSGLIEGDIDLGDGDDVINNKGILNGTVLLGSGNDRFLSGDGQFNGTAEGGHGDDQIETGAGDQVLSGGDGNDRLSSGAGYDSLYGDAGDDILTGGNGADEINGGAGIDTASYADSLAGVHVDLTLAGVQNTSGGGWDNLISIENLTGSRFDDTLIGNVLANTLKGGDGSDAITGGQGDDAIFGNDGKDRLFGGNGWDTLSGGAGDDLIDGGNGQDTASYSAADSAVTVDLSIAGAQDTLGAGIDTLVAIENLRGSDFADTLSGNSFSNAIAGGLGDDAIFGYDGWDRLFGGNGNDVLDGGFGKDTLRGENGSDELLGGGGDDTLVGGDGGDLLLGGNGWDLIYGGGWSDTAHGGNGNDLLQGQFGDDTLYGDNGDDWLSGGVGNDILYGGANNDRLDGGSEKDQLFGGDGDDVLIGSYSSDQLTGGAGADVFYFDDGHASRYMTNTDLITDFNQSDGDLIDLSAVDAIAGGGDDAFTYIGKGAFSGTAGELKSFIQDGDTYIAGDMNGDGVADLVIKLEGEYDLTSTDFSL